MGIHTSNLADTAPQRRREYNYTIFDDAGRATGASAPAEDTIGDILLGYPEPDSNASANIFVVDRVYLQVSEQGGNGANDFVQADVFAGPAGTTMLSTVPKITQEATFPAIALVGGSSATGITHPVLKAASSCEVAAGTGLYCDMRIDNDQTTPFGSITLVVSGYFKDEK